MKRWAVLAGFTIFLFGLAVTALGVAWEEQKAGFQFGVDPETGETQVGFYIFLEYDRPPACTDLDTTWSVYVLRNGAKEVLADYHYRKRKPSCTGRTSWVSFLSPFITPVEGESYGAKITVRDVVNDLLFERVISYTAPVSLPSGVALNVKTFEDEVSEVDLSGVPDEELEELFLLVGSLTSDYVQTASGVVVEDYFDIYAVGEGSYPASVIVVAFLGPTLGASGGGLTIKATYNGVLFTYPLGTPAGAPGVLSHLSEFEQKFSGRVLLARPDAEGIGYLSVFVDDGAWRILEEAVTEYGKR